MDTITKLNMISTLQVEAQSVAEEKQKLIDSVMTDEIKQKLADIDVEFAGKLESVNAKIAELDTQVRQDVLVVGSTIKGDKLMAVWNKGRKSVDMKSLEGYAIAHPEVNAMIKTGDPSVTIRKI